jgi:hypothetical protein
MSTTQNTGLVNSHALGADWGHAEANLHANVIERVGFGWGSYAHDDTAGPTVTASEAANPRLKITGALTAARNAILPTAQGAIWIVWNATTGGFAVTVKTSAGAGVLVPNGKIVEVFCDGTDIKALTYAPTLFLQPGSAVSPVQAGGSLEVNTTAVGNVGAGEDDLMSFSVPANTLGTNGDYLELVAWGSFAANANNKRVRVKFGATTILDTGAVAANSGTWRVQATIIRTGAATQIANASLVTDNTTLGDVSGNASPAETLSGAVAVKLTGEATSDDDVRQLGLTVRWYPAA